MRVELDDESQLDEPLPLPVYVVGWRAGQPRADLFVDEGEAPLGLRALQDRLRRTEAEAAAATPPAGAIAVTHQRGSPGSEHREPMSIVVSTRDRPHSLERCIRSLQTAVRHADQIIVVDNASTGEANSELKRAFPTITWVEERRPGLSIARNTGIRAAQHGLIAFTDDDVEVDPDWLDRLAVAFAEPDVLAVTGCVLPKELKTPAQIDFERAGLFRFGFRGLRFDSEFVHCHRGRGLPVWKIGAGANMAFRRRAFEQLGGFDERLGAGAAGCSEDSEYWYRILASGAACRYHPAAVVSHTHRQDGPELGRQMGDYMRGHVAALLVQYLRYRDRGNIRRLLLELPRHYASRLIFGHRRSQLRSMWFSEVIGCVRGLGAFVIYTLRGRGAPEIHGVGSFAHGTESESITHAEG